MKFAIGICYKACPLFVREPETPSPENYHADVELFNFLRVRSNRDRTEGVVRSILADIPVLGSR